MVLTKFFCKLWFWFYCSHYTYIYIYIHNVYIYTHKHLSSTIHNIHPTFPAIKTSRSWDGYYYLLAYKRSKKLHLPMSGVDSVDSVAKVVEPELVAAPLLLGASSRSRDVGIKDETCHRPEWGPFQGEGRVGWLRWLDVEDVFVFLLDTDSRRFLRHSYCGVQSGILYFFCRDVWSSIISPETHSDKRRNDHQLSQKIDFGWDSKIS